MLRGLRLTTTGSLLAVKTFLLLYLITVILEEPLVIFNLGCLTEEIITGIGLSSYSQESVEDTDTLPSNCGILGLSSILLRGDFPPALVSLVNPVQLGESVVHW